VRVVSAASIVALIRDDAEGEREEEDGEGRCLSCGAVYLNHEPKRTFFVAAV
jgi:hypothetical protein